MYEQVEKLKRNKSRAVANSVAQKKRDGKQGFEFVDNRPEVKQITQLKYKNGWDNQKQTIQCINVGWVPSDPGHYRNVTNVVGATPFTNGGQPFAHRIAAVEFNNIGQAAAGAAIIALPPGHMLSDVGGGDLPTYIDARDITPECDHIVQEAEGGSNDLMNARMTSKAENTNPATPRPHAPAFAGGHVGNAATDVQLRIYTPLTITNNATGAWVNYATGNVVDYNGARSLAAYAGVGFVSWAGLNNAVLHGIHNVGLGVANGYTVV